jgi:tetratricopeptide (TPR) repeat protein
VPSAATVGESLLVPDEGLEPLENVSLDPPGSGDLEAKLNAANTSADSIPAESDSEGVVLVDEAPNGELHITPLHETSPASGIAATQDVAIDEATAADAGTLAADAENPKSTSETPLRDIPPSVGQIARDHLNYGNSLARRGSLYSARQEFFSGLRLVIESLDHVNGLSSHRENYDLAIMALNEAEDFVPASGDQASRSVARIAELHRSKVLSPEQTQTFTPMAAMQAYFAFAQSHFSAACGHTPVASELLYGLGKLYTVKASQEASGEPSDLAVTLLMHEAALHVDPNNYLSANELGVALARLGHYEAARAALLHSVATHASPEAWLNLSVVHQQLGETQLADMAMAEHRSALSKAGQESVAQQQIRWMSPNDFAAAEQVNFEGSHTAGGATAIPTTAGTTAQPAAADSSFWSKFKKTLGR